MEQSMMRADMLGHAAEAFFRHFHAEGLNECMLYESEFKSIMKAYTGWVGRRNEVAHGYVTQSSMPNPLSEKLEMVTSYLLCPSHGNSKKWPLTWEPTYQYRAAEIDRFAAGFDALAKRVVEFAERVENWSEKVVTNTR
jgi:hypothetical protein